MGNYADIRFLYLWISLALNFTVALQPLFHLYVILAMKDSTLSLKQVRR